MEVFFLFAKTLHELSHALTYLCARIYLTNAKDANVKFETTTQANNIRWETGGMERKILGSWKQYSGREFSGFFSCGFRQLHLLSGRIRPEIIGKNLENSCWEYCFHVPDISRVILQDPAAGTIDLGKTHCLQDESGDSIERVLFGSVIDASVQTENGKYIIQY